MSSDLFKSIPVIVLAFFVLICSHEVIAQEERFPEPSADQIKEPMKLVREIYQDDFRSAKTAIEKSELAAEILEAGEQTIDDPVARFVMLRLARDIAILAGDSDTTMNAVYLIIEHYKVDEYQLQLDAIIDVTKRHERELAGSTLDLIVDMAFVAIVRNDFAAIKRLMDVAKKDAKKSGNREMQDAVEELAASLKIVETEFEAVRDDFSILIDNPDDPAANLAVGKFQCFIKGDWGTGLPLLAKTEHKQLKQVVDLELAGPDDEVKKLQVADLWWEIADELTEPANIEVKLRAAAYYRDAATNLTGLQKAKADARFREASELGEVGDVEMELADDKPSMEKDPDDPKDKEEVPRSAFDILPNKLAEETVVYELPAGFDDVAVAAGGRYLVFKIGSLKKLAFFDINEQKITEYVPLENADIRFTAGAESFYIALRQENVIQRWNLSSFRKELTVKLPFENPVDAIVMGSASIGPIYAGAKHSAGVFLNPKTLRPLPYEVLDHVYQRRDARIEGAGPTSRLRASANGHAFSIWETSHSPGGFRTLVLTDRQVHTYYKHDTMGYIAPSPDGELMYTAKGVYTKKTKEFSGNAEMFAKAFPVPAVSGNYSLSVTRDDDRPKLKRTTNSVHIHHNGSSEPILTLPHINIRPGEYSDFHNRELMTLDKRIYYIPQANLLITLPTANKTVVMHDVNLDKELEEAGIDYLYVISNPAVSVRRGGTFKYKVEVKSLQGGVKIKLESGPKGMTINSDGVVTWRTSRKTAESADIILSISDSSGKTITHAFKIVLD